jgi:hypothetical protein
MVTSYYLCEWIGLLVDQAALAMNREAIDLCNRRGLSGQNRGRGPGMWPCSAGEWDEIVEHRTLAAMGRRTRATR